MVKHGVFLLAFNKTERDETNFKFLTQTSTNYNVSVSELVNRLLEDYIQECVNDGRIQPCHKADL